MEHVYFKTIEQANAFAEKHHGTVFNSSVMWFWYPMFGCKQSDYPYCVEYNRRCINY